MLVNLGSHDVPCSIGLSWESDKDNKRIHCLSIVDGKDAQFGFSEDMNDKGSYSAAAWAANKIGQGIVISSLMVDDEIKFWICGVDEGLVLPETDRLYNRDEVESVVVDTMDVLGQGEIHQLCEADLDLGNYKSVYLEFTPESFDENMLVDNHGMDPKVKTLVILVIVGLLASGAFVKYMIDKSASDAAVAAVSASREKAKQESLELAQYTVSHNHTSLFIPIVVRMKSIPHYVRGWNIKDMLWDQGLLTVNYIRDDGTLNTFKEGLGGYTEKIIFDPLDPDVITIEKEFPLSGEVPYNGVFVYNDIETSLLSMFQQMGDNGTEIKTSISGGSLDAPALSWDTSTDHPYSLINSLSQKGFIINSVSWTKSTDKWAFKGDFYAN